MGLLDAFTGEENHQEASGSPGHIDASSILSLVSNLASGDEKSTGAASGIINPSVLIGEIGKLTGMNNTKRTEQAEANHPGLDGNMIMSLVSNLAKGGERETGAQSGAVNHNLLTGVLSAFTGKNGFNAGAMANAILPLLKNVDLKGDFMKNPVKAIEKIIGIDLPDEKIQPVINAIMAKISPKKQ